MLLQNNWGVLSKGMCISRSKKDIQVSSAVVLAITRYSTSELDLDTVGCFFDDQDMRFELRNTQQPKVLLLVAGHPPQSVSQKA